MDDQYTNALVNETSPYLLQHAHNPVNWFPWGEEALQKARDENKLIIVSIGYSSCHWCHVMEHESFEDSTVAQLMNDHFISIKVDREERPDIDHIYMTAVHMMNQRGGWPLNCIALPDGRPIWGGTYLPKDQWMECAQPGGGIPPGKSRTKQNSMPRNLPKASVRIHFSSLTRARIHSRTPASGLRLKTGPLSSTMNMEAWRVHPNFPCLQTWSFCFTTDINTMTKLYFSFVETTLTKMARGGIYDQAGGGFARYSVDPIWKVPHFEKMLYDNAQFVGLYAEAYQVFGKETFLKVVDQSVEFLEREMMSREGLFFSALDADSEGEEGKFYIWTREELEELLEEDFDLFADYYNINASGLWEQGNYILYRTSDPENFAAERALEKDAFIKKIDSWNRILLGARGQRIRPGLDDKSLTSWNSMMISGLAKAYRATGNPSYLEMALKSASAIREKIWDGEKVLFRNYKNGKRSIPGFHIDYALYTRACLDLFEVNLDPFHGWSWPLC